MEITEETKLLLDKINADSNKSVKNITEVSVLINNALQTKSKKKFNDLIFKAKYINGLNKVLSNRIVIGDDYMEKIFNEFNKNLLEFSDLLKDIIISVNDPETEEHFTERYFKLNQESIVNSMGLIEDLTLCKEYFNNASDKFFGI